MAIKPLIIVTVCYNLICFIVVLVLFANPSDLTKGSNVYVETKSVPVKDISAEKVEEVKVRVLEDTQLYDLMGSIIGSLRKGTILPGRAATKIHIEDIPTRVMHLKNGFVKLSALDLPAELETAVDYRIDNTSIFRLLNGQKTEIKLIRISRTKHLGLQYFILNEDNPFMMDWEKAGTYVFGAAGKLVTILPIGAGETSYGVCFSPNEKYVAEESGTWTIWDLEIYTYPKMNKIGAISCYNYYWLEDDYILFTAVSDSSKPQCPIDLSGYLYVAVYDLANDKIIPVKMHDELSEYQLVEAKDDVFLLEQTYVEKLDDWANHELWKRQRIEVSNPLQAMGTK